MAGCLAQRGQNSVAEATRRLQGVPLLTRLPTRDMGASDHASGVLHAARLSELSG